MQCWEAARVLLLLNGTKRTPGGLSATLSTGRLKHELDGLVGGNYSVSLRLFWLSDNQIQLMD